MQPHFIDLIIIVVYFIVLLFIGWWSGRKKSESSAEDFFLTRNTLPWYAIGFSIIAAGVSSEQFLGTVGFAYQYGLSVANWEWLNGPAILLLIFIFIPVYFRWKIVTMPQFLEMRYSSRVKSVFAIITLFTYIFINMAGVIYSGGFALHKILGMDLYIGIWLLTIVGGFFVVYGGMESVAWTNVFQAVLLLGAGLLVFILGLIYVPGGFTSILGEGERAHLILPADHPVIPSTGLIVLAISTNVWFFCTNQTINQSSLGAKNINHAKLGILFAGFLGLLVAFADVFPGMIAFALNPNLTVADSAFPYVVNELVPVGLRGVVYAGLLGAIISTIEALGNASATIFTFDIYKPWKKEAVEKKLIRAGRIAGIIALVTGAVWSPIVMQFGHIFSYFQECWAFIAIPVAVVFVLGVLWKRITESAAFWTLMLSFPMLLLPYLLRIGDVAMNVFNVAGIVCLFTVGFTVILSLITQTEKSIAGHNLWKEAKLQMVEEKLPMWKSSTFWAIVLAVFYICTYIYFW